MPRYDREIAAGRLAAALVTALKGTGVEPLLGKLPRAVLVPLFAFGLSPRDRAADGDVPLRALVPTQHFDMQLIRELAGTLADYAALPARALVLDGSRSPAYLRLAVERLSQTLPRAERVTFAGLGHSGPDDSGQPARVAAALRRFF